MLEAFSGIWDFMSSPAGAAIGFGLWVISEALASIPALQANSVFQLVHQVLSRFKRPAVPVLLCAVLLGGCSAASTTLKNAASTWCSYAEAGAIHAMTEAVLSKIPDGTDKDKAAQVIAYVGPGTEAACEVVKALQASQQVAGK